MDTYIHTLVRVIKQLKQEKANLFEHESKIAFSECVYVSVWVCPQRLDYSTIHIKTARYFREKKIFASWEIHGNVHSDEQSKAVFSPLS